MKKIIVFDTETNGFNPKYNDIVQLSWVMYDENGTLLKSVSEYIKGSLMSEYNKEHLSITQYMLDEQGADKTELLNRFLADAQEADIFVAHNIEFDYKFINENSKELGDVINSKKYFCTMKSTCDLVGIETPYGNKYPKLSELYQKLFGVNFEGAHDALNDTRATARCFFQLVQIGHFII